MNDKKTQLPKNYNAIIIPILPVSAEIENIALECIRRIEMFSRENAHVITVVNGGRMDGAFLDALNARTDLLIHPDRLGYAGAVNKGLLFLQANYPQPTWVTIGSCDVYISENWQGHLQSMDSLVSGLDMSKTYQKDYGYRGNFWAAWWTMPNNVVEQVGYFDMDFNLRFAAQDYAIRAHELGYRSVRANIRFDHVAAKHSSVGETFRKDIRDEERRFRAKYQGAYNYNSWLAAKAKSARV